MQRWWRTDEHLRRRPYLLKRNAIMAAFRAWFAVRDFITVEGAALQISPGNEAHLHAFATSEVGLDGSRAQLYLHTSPEFTAKKLLAAGETKIVDFARVFRNRERSALHHPEFTMLEWYRTHEPYEALMDDCAALLALAAMTAGASQLVFRGRRCDPLAHPERLTVADAFLRHAGVDLMATVDGQGSGDRSRLDGQAKRIGVRTAADDSWSDIYSRILQERIEPHLGLGAATILCEYPIGEAALARPKPADPRLAERFELYACGVELANAFCELTDPVEQRRRFEDDMTQKQAIYGERYPIDEDLLAALPLMPPTSGIALGLDRLVMLAVGADSITDVIWTPVAEQAMTAP
ncbi:MAG: EF-P lysine aminoacylase EpmA [Hyphomicrobiales bacterium]|nr:EF-P lysine aminoacylase EpmA [Hyphomicrobiales bacterium]